MEYNLQKLILEIEKILNDTVNADKENKSQFHLWHRGYEAATRSILKELKELLKDIR